MRKLLPAFLVAALTISLHPIQAAACGAPDIQPRRILAIFDSRQEPEPRATRLHAYLELPLNYLGYELDYVDLAAPTLPDISKTEAAATVSWFDEPVNGAERYFAWQHRLADECGGAFRTIAFGQTGAPASEDAETRAYLGRLGLQAAGPQRLLGERTAVVSSDPAMIGWETGFVPRPGRYDALRAAAGAQALLSVAASAQDPAQAVDLAVTSRSGGYVEQTAALGFDGRAGAAFWVIDPFAFLRKVMGTGPWPAPDVTTLEGRRIFFATVGPGGWLAMTPLREFGEEPRLGAEELLNRLIRPNADLPMTVAIVTGDLDPALSGRLAAPAREAAREILAQPQISAATAGATGVNRWAALATLSGTIAHDQGALPEAEGGGLMGAAIRNLGQAFYATPAALRRQSSESARHYDGQPFSLDDEIAGALAGTAALAPSDRPPAVFVWGGDARPFAQALDAVSAAGATAIGGGGGIYNRFSPTLTGLSAFSAEVGDQRQVYDALSGDDAYTGFLTAHPYGYQALAQTLDWTETPRRLKPFQLSFSAGSSIPFGARASIRALLALARSDAYIPVTAADYTTYIKGFDDMRVHPAGPLAWRIEDRGALQTVRFDRSGGLALDLDHSEGVIGARRKGASLYVALDPSVQAPIVRLLENGAPAGMVSATGRLGLGSSRVRIERWTVSGCRTEMAVAGWGAGSISLLAPPGAAFRVELARDGATGPAHAIGADGEGWLQIPIPDLGGHAAILRVTGSC